MKKISWVAIFVAITIHGYVFAGTQRLPTLDDVASVKTTGGIAISPDEQSIAIQVEGKILILGARPPFAEIKQLDGTSPSWSPDGSSLAFYQTRNEESEIYIWHKDVDAVEQITRVSGGISPSPMMLGSNDKVAWSPDSSKLAFCTRVMGDYKKEGLPDTREIRAFNTNESSWMAVLANVFHTGSFWDAYAGDSSFPPDRMRAIERHPEWGLSRLFTVDVKTKELRRLTRRGQHFSPTWSPDGKQITVIAEAGRGDGNEFPNQVPWIRTSEISMFDAVTGEEVHITPPNLTEDSEYEYVGRAEWSADGKHIATWEKTGTTKFIRVLVYSISDRRWTVVPLPGGRSVSWLDPGADLVQWTSDGKALLVRAADRFGDTFWLINPYSGTAKQLDTGDPAIGDLAVSALRHTTSGDIYFTAEGPRFSGRLYRRSPGDTSAPQEVYDPNPQISGLKLGEQRRVTWTNKAGEQVDGIVTFPPDYIRGRRYPVIVDAYPIEPRNGFKVYSPQLKMGQLQAARGYIVFQPNLRTPMGGYNFTRDETYTEKARGPQGVPIMIDDFTSGLDYLSNEGIADLTRIGLFGLSNGGFVANFLITETQAVKCAVIDAGVSNVLTPFPFSMHFVNGYDFTTNTYMHFPEDIDGYIRMSPILRMKNVTASVLLIVGDDDWTWLSQMINEYGVLRSLRKDVQFVRYANEEHVFRKPENIKDVFNRENAFFDGCLRP